MNLNSADREQFHRLGITDEILQRAGVKRVADGEARDLYGIKGSGDMAGIIFPYYDPVTGRRVTARLRRDNPDIENSRPKRKYVSAYGDRRHLYFPPGANELIEDASVPIVLVEAEKSVLAGAGFTTRTGQTLLFIGLGGCYGWKGRVGKVDGSAGERVDEYGALPELNICRAGRRTFVLLDSNAATNPQVQAARRCLTKQLRKQGADVQVLDLPTGVGINGPDDFISVRGDEAFTKILAGCVDGAALLDEVLGLLATYFYFPNSSQAVLVALWIAHTYIFDLFPWTPYLGISSPTKQCGKSRLLEILGYLVNRPRAISNTTSAALFRIIEKHNPTILFDETDATFKGDPEMQQAIRGVLNAGAKRGGCATRVVGKGKDMDVQDFNVFCPKALSGIGYLPDTVADRSIVLRIQRKPKAVKLPKIRERRFREITDPIRRRLESWTSSIRSRLDGVEPHMPEGLDDRKEDGAEVLLAIADEAGGGWPQEARKALVRICGSAPAVDDDYRVQLLADARTILQDVTTEVVTSQLLIEELCAMEDRPWKTFGKISRGLTAKQLGDILNGFEIYSKQMRKDGKKIRGYSVADFAPVFSCYLDSEPVQAVQPQSITSANHLAPSGTESICTACENREITSKTALCTACTALRAGNGEEPAEEVFLRFRSMSYWPRSSGWDQSFSSWAKTASP